MKTTVHRPLLEGIHGFVLAEVVELIMDKLHFLPIYQVC